jgi:hypothetical protein
MEGWSSVRFIPFVRPGAERRRGIAPVKELSPRSSALHQPTSPARGTLSDISCREVLEEVREPRRTGGEICTNGLNGVTMRLRLLQPYILRMEFRVFPSIFARNGINGITKSLSKYPQKTDYTTAQKLMFLSGLDLHQVLQERDFLWGIGCRQTRGAARRGRRDLTTLTQTRIVPHRWSRQSRRRGEFLCVHGA